MKTSRTGGRAGGTCVHLLGDVISMPGVCASLPFIVTLQSTDDGGFKLRCAVLGESPSALVVMVPPEARTPLEQWLEQCGPPSIWRKTGSFLEMQMRALIGDLDDLDEASKPAG